MLDVTQPPSAQGPRAPQPGPPPALPPGAFAWEVNCPPDGHTGIAGGAAAEVAVDPPRTVEPFPGFPTTTTPLGAIPAGGTIGPGLTFAGAGTTTVLNRTFGPTPVFPDRAYAATRLTLSDGVHYGFIELDLTRGAARRELGLRDDPEHPLRPPRAGRRTGRHRMRRTPAARPPPLNACRVADRPIVTRLISSRRRRIDRPL